MDKLKVQNIVIEYCRAEGINQVELTERLDARLRRVGLSSSVVEVSRWKTGERLPSYPKVIIVYLISDDSLKALAGNILAAMRPEIWGKNQ